MLPEFEINLDETEFVTVEQPWKTYRDRSTNIAGYVNHIEAVRQTVEHILHTERYAYPIYDENYGMSLEKYIGQPFEYLEATIENDLREALTQDDRIYGVKVLSVLKTNIDSAELFFEVQTTEGLLEMEVTIGL